MAYSGEGAIRCADAVMRAAGGRTVYLRIAAPAVPNDDAEQLGLATPEFQDVALGPAAFHKADSVGKLLVSASAVDAVLGTLAYDSADVLFETAVGVVVDVRREYTAVVLAVFERCVCQYAGERAGVGVVVYEVGGGEMTDFEGQVLQELSVLKAQMQHLMGIGQPGRLHQLEARVEAHERSVQRLKGMGASLGGLLTILQMVIAYLTERHS